jgi:hypothetical protein
LYEKDNSIFGVFLVQNVLTLDRMSEREAERKGITDLEAVRFLKSMSKGVDLEKVAHNVAQHKDKFIADITDEEKVAIAASQMSDREKQKAKFALAIRSTRIKGGRIGLKDFFHKKPKK